MRARCARRAGPLEQPTIALRDGNQIPQLGLRVFQIPRGDVTRAAVSSALAAGYRHVDTAAIHGNESDVGAAMRASGPLPGSVWVTTKLGNAEQGAPTARRAFEASLERLGVDGVDLYLLHGPHELRLESWRVLERPHAEGLDRSIGVSNVLVRHLDELLAHASEPPAINQIELTPFLHGSWEDTVRRCADAGIVVEAHRPLPKGRRLDDSTVSAIAAGSAELRHRSSSAGRCRAAFSCFRAPRTPRVPPRTRPCSTACSATRRLRGSTR